MNDIKVVRYMQIPLTIKPEDSKRLCFIVYSSREPHIEITIDAIETVLEATGKYEAKRLAVDGVSGRSQYSQLNDFLNDCVLSIVILDGLRPNVLFEYGILIGLQKPCIVLLENQAMVDIKSLLKSNKTELSPVPVDIDKDFSDVKDQMYVTYDCTKPKDLRTILNVELKKIESLVEDTLMRLVFPQKEIIENEVSDSLYVFSSLSSANNSLLPDDEIKFRVCTNEIERVSAKYNINLTTRYYHNKIDLLCDFNKKAEALSLIESLDHLSDIGYLLRKHRILIDLNRQDEAMECLNKAIYINDKEEVLWHNKALLLERINKKDEAILCYKKGILYNNKCSAIHNHYGLLLLDDGNYDEAIQQFDKALFLKPNESSYLVCKAICLKEKRETDAAIATLHDAICFNEKNADAWFQLGLLSIKDDDAIKYFDKCLSIKNNHTGALCSKGAALSNSGKLEEAIEVLSFVKVECRLHNGNGCSTLNENLGRTKLVLYLSDKIKFKDYIDESKKHFEIALEKSTEKSEQEECVNNLGFICLALGSYDQALSYLTVALEKKSDNININLIVLYNLSLAYSLKGLFDNAIKYLDILIDLAKPLPRELLKSYCLFCTEIYENNLIIKLNMEKPDLLESATVAINIYKQLKESKSIDSEEARGI